MKKFKINTATQKAAIQKMEVAASIMRKAHIDASQWSAILFNVGCKFIEQNIADTQLQQRLLQDEKLCFWDWFIIVFINDDETLLNYHHINNAATYTSEKERIIYVLQCTNQLQYFLKSNKELQAIEEMV